MSETLKDIHNVEAWTQVIEQVVHLAPRLKRTEILERILERERAERKKEEEWSGSWRCVRASDIDWQNSPGVRHWDTIKRLTSLVVQVLVRNITCYNSPKTASKLLFAHHRYGTGSGNLDEYLVGRLPPTLQRRQ
jgi:hypothetical protein